MYVIFRSKFLCRDRRDGQPDRPPVKKCRVTAFVNRSATASSQVRSPSEAEEVTNIRRARLPVPDGDPERPSARGGGSRGVPQRGVDAVPRRARLVQKTHGRGVRGESASAPLFSVSRVPERLFFASGGRPRSRGWRASFGFPGRRTQAPAPQRQWRRATFDDARGTYPLSSADASHPSIPKTSSRLHDDDDRRSPSATRGETLCDRAASISSPGTCPRCVRSRSVKNTPPGRGS